MLKQYIMEGYAINEKRMFALQKTVNIQTKMLAYSLDLEEKEILKAVNPVSYTHLDVYKRQTNNREGSATGFASSYGPYALMVVLAGAVAFVLFRKRRAEY